MTSTSSPLVSPHAMVRSSTSMGVRQYVTLVRTLASSEFKLRFAESILGYVWTLSKPLMLFGVMYVVFSQMLRFGEGIPHYTVVLLMGIMVWGFFSEATSGAVTVLVARADLIRKASFPRSALAAAVVATSFMVFLTNLVALFVFVLINHVRPRLEWFALVPLLAELIIFTLGVALLLSGLYVFVRDIGQIWVVLLQLGFYATPIIYPLELLDQRHVDERWKELLVCNPIAQILVDARAALVGTSPWSWQVLDDGRELIPFAIVAVACMLGAWTYRRFTGKLAERV